VAAARLLRPGLLDGLSVLVAEGFSPCGEGSPDRPVGRFGAAVADACTALGARVARWAPGEGDAGAGGGDSEAAANRAVADAEQEVGALEVVVVDGAGLFAGRDAAAALRSCLARSWNVTRAVANHAFLARGGGGRVVLIAPAPGAGEHATAAMAGLENLARTLSVEWSRHAITAVAVAPGEETSAGEVAALCAYLASEAGAYFSGCLMDLRGGSHPAA
jgi:NAD(P)-dependent dehydrogenase (short-subunit alcohol dehydrogenase family)